VRKLLPLLLVACLLTACMADGAGRGLDIVNETDAKLYIYEAPVGPDGGARRYETAHCSDTDLAVRTGDGDVVAELTEKWCPGQTWTITGQDESTLTDG
jgi:hypothetical protein